MSKRRKKNYKHWDFYDTTFLKNNAHRLPDKEIARILDRGQSAVCKERQRLGLKKKAGRGKCEMVRRTIINYPKE